MFGQIYWQCIKKSRYSKKYPFSSSEIGRAILSGPAAAIGAAVYKTIGTGAAIKRGYDRANNPNSVGILSKSNIGCKGGGSDCWNVGFGVKSPNLIDKFLGGIQNIFSSPTTEKARIFNPFPPVENANYIPDYVSSSLYNG